MWKQKYVPANPVFWVFQSPFWNHTYASAWELYLQQYLADLHSYMWITLLYNNYLCMCLYYTCTIPSVSNLQGGLWYHAAKPSRQMTTNVINFLSILSTGTILISVWMILYYINSTALTLTLLPALLLNINTQNVFINNVYTWCMYGTWRE